MNRFVAVALWMCNALVYLALIDVTIEAALRHSALAIAGGALLVSYTALVALFWRGFDLTVRAELGVAILIGLLAFDGWRLGSIAAPGSMTLLAVPGDALGASFALALLLSLAVAALAMPRAPVWLRALVVLVLAYPISGLGLAIARGSGLSGALANNAPFPNEPAILRGTLFAAAVVFPAASAGALVASLVLLARKRSILAGRVAAAALIFALATQMTGLEAATAGLPAKLAFGSRAPATPSTFMTAAQIPQTRPPSSSDPVVAPAPATSLSAVATTTSTASATADVTTSGDAQGAVPPENATAEKRADDLAATLPKQSYQLDAAADALPAGVGPAFAFVRDRIGFESYAGVLRGARGTFTAHAGNALDRSLMLAYILQRQHIPVRLATGRLTPALAERLYARIFTMPAPIAVASTAPLAAPASDADIVARIYARAKNDYGVVHAALGTMPDAKVPSHDDLIAEIESHAWLQAQMGGNWIDLDTAFPDATPGHAYTTAEGTYTQVPDDVQQHVTVRVITDFLEHGTVTSDTALSVTVPAQTLIDKQVFLGHGGIGFSGIMGSPDTKAPVLWIAGDEHSGKPIAFANAAAATTSLGAAAGLLSAGNATPAAAASGPEFVTEWLEFEIDEPGGKKIVTRRTIVDRAGDRWRASAAHDPAALAPLARNADGLVATQTLYNVWFTAGDHDLRSYADAVSAFEGSVRSTTASPASASPASASAATASAATMTFADQVWPVALRNFALLVLADHVIVPKLNDLAGVRFYADSPRITIFSLGPDPAGKLAAIDETDLRRDALRGVERDPGSETAILDHKLWYGALEGALEDEVAAVPGGPAVVGTSALLDAGGVVVLRPGSNADEGAVDPETAARIRSALAAGDTLVVPKAVLRGGISGWWQIENGTGDVRAVLGPDLGGIIRGLPRSLGRAPAPGGSNNFGVWGVKNGRTVQLNSSFSSGGGGGMSKRSPGGGELGEYNATNDVALAAVKFYVGLGLLCVEVVTVAMTIIWAATTAF